MTKVLIVGDTHGDPQFVSNIHRAARDHEVESIIQLGDFGYNFDRNLLASIGAWLDRDENHSWFWIDGNHDQHDYIEQDILSVVPNWNKPVAHFHERMFYVPRGAVFAVGGTNVLGLGGAYSIDKYRRSPGVSWWEQEMIRPSDMLRAVANATRVGQVDVMITHDAPMSDELGEMLNGAGYKVDYDSAANRAALTRVVDEVRPQRLYHGHYHHRYQTVYTTPEGWDVDVEGIGANVNPRGYIDHTAIQNHNYIIEEW